MIWKLPRFNRSKAERELLEALDLFLLISPSTVEAIQEWQKDRWDDFVDKILLGDSPHATALNLIMAFIVITIDEAEKSPDILDTLIDALWDENYENSPWILDIIAYVTLTTEKLVQSKELDSMYYWGFIKHIAERFTTNEDTQVKVLEKLDKRVNWLKQRIANPQQ